jgi:hypothetical protein
MSCLCHESNPGHPACTLSLYQLSYPGSRVIFQQDTNGSNGFAAWVLALKASNNSCDFGVVRGGNESFCLLGHDAV